MMGGTAELQALGREEAQELVATRRWLGKGAIGGRRGGRASTWKSENQKEWNMTRQ